tara:strand:- start:1075 stop:1632 length:558 start_codon:yes stop_codon:yes gene_type:complete
VKYILTSSIFVLLLACSTYDDRTVSPETSLSVAKKALQNKDLEKYFDALTNQAVLNTLKNSIAICSNSKIKEVKQYGYEESSGCNLILKKYGWQEPVVAPENITESWKKELEKIKNPRAMVVELETNHREKGAGASFVWWYLESVNIISTEIRGNEAIGEVDWSGESKKVLFVRDSTGWRFDPNY